MTFSSKTSRFSSTLATPPISPLNFANSRICVIIPTSWDEADWMPRRWSDTSGSRLLSSRARLCERGWWVCVGIERLTEELSRS